MSESDSPGFTIRPRKNGPAYYWIAANVVGDARGFPIKTVRLPDDEEEARARCRVLTAELREWMSGRPLDVVAYDGTVGSLIATYRNDEDSPYRGVRENTRKSYDYDLDILDRQVGEVRIDGLTRKDFARWHRSFASPKVEDGAPRMRRAHGLMNMLRMLLGFGKSMKLAGCRDALDVIEEMTFPQPERRDKAITFGQAAAVVDAALAAGARSIALGQAIQFELGLRQIDVIGRWTAGAGVGGIAYGQKMWGGGLTWADLSAERLAKRTSKTGQEGQWNPAAYPLLVRAMAAFAEEERVGPAVIDERTGQPYKGRNAYGKAWRKVADAAGVPRGLWNMDSRAGALTEAAEAGAAMEDIRKFATHAAAATTQRYVRRTGEATDRVAELRVRHREKGKGDV